MGTPNISDQEANRTINAIHKALEKGYRPPGIGGKGPNATTVAAKAIGLNRSSMRSRIHAVEAAGHKIDWSRWSGDKKSEVEIPDFKTRDVEARLKHLRKQLEIAHKGEAEARRTLEAVLGIKDEISDQPLWTLQPPKKTSSSYAGVPTTVWSDWQYGETVDKAEVAGINEYNSDIAKARIKRLVERTIELSFTHMANPVYPGAVVMLGGDMISGGIHPELMDTDDRTPPESVIDLFGILRTSLLEMAKAYRRLFIPCVVGNHGRTTQKIRHKGRVRYSYEFILYRFLKESFADDKRFCFFIPNEIDAYFKVHSHRYRLTHGDSLGTRGGDGIIGVYGKVRRGAVKIRNAEAPLGRDHDTLVIGHYHQYFALPDLVINPTIVGFSEYAKSELRAVPEPPAQAMWFTHPQYGVIWANRVFVERGAISTNDAWVSWQDKNV